MSRMSFIQVKTRRVLSALASVSSRKAVKIDSKDARGKAATRSNTNQLRNHRRKMSEGFRMRRPDCGET
jgi:hypothetical protein